MIQAYTYTPYRQEEPTTVTMLQDAIAHAPMTVVLIQLENASEKTLEELIKSITQTEDASNILRWAHFPSDSREVSALQLLFRKAPKTINYLQDASNNTALSHAVLSGNPDLVQWLLDLKADPLICNSENQTLLHQLYFTTQNRKAIAQLLLNAIPHKDAPSLVNKKDLYGLRVLTYAIELGDLDTTGLLLEHGADPLLSSPNQSTPLHSVARSPHPTSKKLAMKLVQYIEKQNLSHWINIKDTSRKTALWHAVDNHNSPVIKYLLKNGADPKFGDSHDISPLHLIAKSDHPLRLEIAKNLIRKFPIIDRTTNDGQTALHYACDSGNLGIVMLLIQSRANPNTVDHEAVLPLHHAALSGKKYRLEIIDLLLEKKPETLNQKDGTGITPIMAAALVGDLPVMQYLHHRGADITLLDENQDSLLHTIAQSSLTLDDDIIPFLEPLIHLFAINAYNSAGYTPLHEAIANRHLPLVKLYIEHGADPLLRTHQRETCLDLAEDDEEITNELVKIYAANTL